MYVYIIACELGHVIARGGRGVALPLIRVTPRRHGFYIFRKLDWSGVIGLDEPEIGDMDECVVEGGEDTGNAKDELTCAARGTSLAK